MLTSWTSFSARPAALASFVSSLRLKGSFFVFDRDKKGFITQEEMRLFVVLTQSIK